jgi:hypothetical protein
VKTGSDVEDGRGRNAQTLQGFFDELTDEQKDSIRAVSIDMSAGYEKAITEAVPHAQVAFDPFHVVQLGGKAADQVRRAEYNRHGRSSPGEGKWIKGPRYSLLKDTANQTPKQLLKLARLCSPTSESTARSCCSASCATSTGCRRRRPSSGSTRGSGGPPAPTEAVRQTRAHDPQTQTGRTRRNSV